MYIANSRATTKHFFFLYRKYSCRVAKGHRRVWGVGVHRWGSTGTGGAVPPGAEGRRGGDRRGNRGSEADARGGREEGTLRGQGARRSCGPGRSRPQPGALLLLPLALLSCGRSLGWTQWWSEGREPLTCPLRAHSRMVKRGAGKFQERHRWMTCPRSQYPGAARRPFLFLGFNSRPPLGGSGA